MLPDSTLQSLSLPVPSLVGFLLTAACLPFYIAWLKRRQIGQFIREEGPASHSAKAQTPTMGGVSFMLAAAAAALAWLAYARGLEPGSLLVLGAGVGCGLLGLSDDLSKLAKKTNAGLSARLRLLCEFAIGAGLALALVGLGGGAKLIVPALLSGEAATIMLPLPLFVVTGAFLVAACANAMNLHDGMDGLAAGTSMQVLSTMGLILLASGQWTLAAVAAACAGALCAFLLFNKYPAAVFMGDTGSLFVGGLMGALALSGGIEIWFVPLTLIYIVETLSVMIQVVYFKVTKEYTPDKPMSAPAILWLKLTRRLPGEGKRFFRMAPLHHHFEAIANERGGSEWQVVAWFWVAQLIICLTVLFVFKPA